MQLGAREQRNPALGAREQRNPALGSKGASELGNNAIRSTTSEVPYTITPGCLGSSPTGNPSEAMHLELESMQLGARKKPNSRQDFWSDATGLG
eukprot:9776075-Alexandrium_andersonii.AAC.1